MGTFGSAGVESIKNGASANPHSPPPLNPPLHGILNYEYLLWLSFTVFTQSPILECFFSVAFLCPVIELSLGDRNGGVAHLSLIFIPSKNFSINISNCLIFK